MRWEVRRAHSETLHPANTCSRQSANWCHHQAMPSLRRQFAPVEGTTLTGEVVPPKRPPGWRWNAMVGAFLRAGSEHRQVRSIWSRRKMVFWRSWRSKRAPGLPMRQPRCPIDSRLAWSPPPKSFSQIIAIGVPRVFGSIWCWLTLPALSGALPTPFGAMVEAPISADPGLGSMSIRERFSDMEPTDGIGAREIGNGTRNS